MASPPVISLEDYDAIAAAVMETERGRWFLAEFARRNRAADTAAVLEALAAVEARLAERPMLPTSGAPSPDVIERVAAAAQIAERLRVELAASNRQGRFFTRTAAQVEEIERELALALAALRPGARRSAETRPAVAHEEPTPPAPPLVDDAADEARKAAEDRRLADLAEELARPIEFEEPEIIEVLADGAARSVAAQSVPVERGFATDAAPSPEPGGNIALNDAPYEHRRGALPKAWTPSLLDSLSETEKAMLFA